MSKILLPVGSGRSAETITGDYNEIYAHDNEDERKAKLEMWIAKQVGEKLVAAYNNRQWKVIVDLKNQMLIVACDSISNNKGYHIKMAGRTIHDLQEKAVRAAGEILERHNLTRARKFDPDIIETLARNSQDDVIATDAEPEPI